MNIGFIGGGQVAQTVGTALSMRGHNVRLSSRTPDNLRAKISQSDTLSVGSFEEAASFGEVIFLALKWDGLEEVLRALDPTLLQGKIVIDPTNATKLNTETNTGELLPVDGSVGETVQRLLPASRVVKAMSVSAEVDPARKDGTPMMPIAGNDAEAKQTVTQLLNELGWEYVSDQGSIAQCRPIEALSVFMMDYVFGHQNFSAAFTVLES